MAVLQGGQPKYAERVSDNAPDSFAELRKSLRPNKVLPERYLDGEVALHFHMRVRTDHVERPPSDLCAVFERLPSCVLGTTDADVVGDDWNGRVDGGMGCDRREYRAVLVGIGQLPENGQRMKVNPLRSFMRLDRLDQCEKLAVRIDARERPPLFPSRWEHNAAEKVVSVVVDGEGGPFCDPADNATHKVVEGGTKALDEVSADDAQTRRRLGVDDYVDAVASGIKCWIGVVGMGFALEESSDLVLERFQMLIRPV